MLMTRQARRWCLAAALLAALTLLPALPVVPATPGLPTAPAAEAQTCTLNPTRNSSGQLATVPRTIEVDGDDRAYRLRVPAGLSEQAMLVVSLHGLGSSAERQETVSGLSAAAGEYDFIVAYPEGRFGVYPPEEPFPLIQGWDPRTNSPDVGFLRAVVRDISEDYCVHPGRVHVEGFSLGALMAQRMACSAADVFASAMSHATSAGPNNPDFPCTPSRPVSVFLSCGANDTAAQPPDTDDEQQTCIPQRNAWGTVVGGCPAGRPADDHDRPDDAFGWAETLACDGAHVWRRVWEELPSLPFVFAGHAYPAGADLAEYHAEMFFFFFVVTPRTSM